MYTLEDLIESLEQDSAMNKIDALLEDMQEELFISALILESYITPMSAEQSLAATQNFEKYKECVRTFRRYTMIVAAQSIAMGDPRVLDQALEGLIALVYVLGHIDGSKYTA